MASGRTFKNSDGSFTTYDDKGTSRTFDNGDGSFTTYGPEGSSRTFRNNDGSYTTYGPKGAPHTYQTPNGSFTTYNSFEEDNTASFQNFDGRYSHHKGGGCYIDTCVYGSSNDCPEVRVLRRLRDRCLSASVPGRLFIRFYYAVSPGLVRRLGNNRLFRRTWLAFLGTRVMRLKKTGYEESPYKDR